MDSYISHHGIKGMKWGVRRTPEQLGHRTSGKRESGGKGSAPSSSKREVQKHSDYERAHNNKRVEEMSDQELRERLNRINMEKQYEKLNPTSVERGKAIMKEVSSILGTTVSIIGGVTAIRKTAGKVGEIIQQWFDSGLKDIDWWVG